MPFKPMKRRDFERWIRQYGWSLAPSGAGDWIVISETGEKMVLFIKITHPGGEVVAYSVQKTRQALVNANKI